MNNDLLKPTGETYKIKCHIICNTLNDENEEMIVAVNSIYAIAWRSLKKVQDFNGVWTRDLTIPVRCSLMRCSTLLFFFSGFFTQLHKLRSLRRPSLHFHFISAVHIWFISYITNTFNVIDMIQCRVCNLQYIGGTKPQSA